MVVVVELLRGQGKATAASDEVRRLGVDTGVRMWCEGKETDDGITQANVGQHDNTANRHQRWKHHTVATVEAHLLL